MQLSVHVMGKTQAKIGCASGPISYLRDSDVMDTVRVGVSFLLCKDQWVRSMVSEISAS
jgi:hypothetical protein